jgi:hypothetical protein
MAWYHKVFPSGWFAEKYLQQGNANLSLATLSIWLGGYEGAILGIIVSQVVLSQPIETNATAREFLTFSDHQDCTLPP